MNRYPLPLGTETLELALPPGTEVLSMSTPETLADPEAAIAEALVHSINSPSLDELIAAKLAQHSNPTAVIVISDSTRPVPYTGPAGILWPIIAKLLEHGIDPGAITVLVATGTHRPNTLDELKQMLDPRVFEHNIAVVNHDCRDTDNLAYLGKTQRGSQVYINKTYLNADIKILTGLVESHFMAGASGGRKSICPGLIGEASTYIFHGAEMLSSPEARDLVLEGNPCHEEALEVAKMAGADYIVNVTLDHQFRLTGVFAGELEAAHQKAFERVFGYVSIPIAKPYDIVVTHAGFVGVNHYQAAKVAVASIPALKPNGKLIIAANNTDPDPVGSPQYRTVLHLLKLMGAEKFKQLILSPDWTFIPEQWQVQMWARVFDRIPQEHLVYYSPQLTQRDYAFVPGVAGNRYLAPERVNSATAADIPQVISAAVSEAVQEFRAKHNTEPTIAYLADGPYGIPVTTKTAE